MTSWGKIGYPSRSHRRPRCDSGAFLQGRTTVLEPDGCAGDRLDFRGDHAALDASFSGRAFRALNISVAFEAVVVVIPFELA